MTNPFNLYSGKKYKAEGLSFTRELMKAWREFVITVRDLRVKGEWAGADDTASREDQVKWLKKKLEDLY